MYYPIKPRGNRKVINTYVFHNSFNDKQINRIFGPIGIKLGGRSAPEIALSIISQLVSEVYKK